MCSTTVWKLLCARVWIHLHVCMLKICIYGSGMPLSACTLNTHVVCDGQTVTGLVQAIVGTHVMPLALSLFQSIKITFDLTFMAFESLTLMPDLDSAKIRLSLYHH